MKGPEPRWGVEADSSAPGSLLTGGQLRQEFLLLPPVSRHLLKTPRDDCERHARASTSVFGPAQRGGRTGFSPALLTRFWTTGNHAATTCVMWLLHSVSGRCDNEDESEKRTARTRRRTRSRQFFPQLGRYTHFAVTTRVSDRCYNFLFRCPG